MATKDNKKQQQERELTGKESLTCMLLVAVVFLLASIDESKEWQATEWVRMVLAIVVGLGTCVYQYKRMHTHINNKEA